MLAREVNILWDRTESIDKHETEEKWHWRVETRLVEVFERKSTEEATEKRMWLIECVMKVTRTRIKLDPKKEAEHKTCIEVSYYIWTRLFLAEEAQRLIRGHRAIENSLHYVKDESMNEDKSRIRVKADNRTRFKTCWLNVLRANNVNNIKRELDENRMSFQSLKTKYSSFFI
jgi:predicted transposase YbfD/YdcC